MRNIQDKLKDKILTQYINILNDFDDEFGHHFDKIVEYVSNIDYINANASNAYNFKYNRPQINTNSISSYFNVTQLRHPIVEQIQTNIEYVSNDITLGYENNGILLYGINSAGKSTLMKSVGIALIMAQAGMFVSCNELIYKPYNKIFTRIPNGDNIMKAQSTFTVEVNELRNILKRSDNNSLVIGDELCSGTESVSALSIVSAGIIELYNRKASFIFASHLHDLTNISRLKNLDKLKIYHLSVSYDEIDNKLIYNRKLQPGNGSTLYGLEVCKSLGLGNEFIELANDIRKELLDIESSILSTKTSIYNSNKIIDVCEICKKKSSDVHHIKEQHTANNEGFIGNHHKNELFNLMCVCKECHYNIHHNKININGYKQTSNGVELIYEIINNNDKNIEHHRNIVDLYKSGKNIIEIITIMEKEYNFKTSRYKINKIIKQLS